MVTFFNKWLFTLLIPAAIYSTGSEYEGKLLPPEPGLEGSHPLHVSVTEINHNAAEKTLEISCKLFTDDFEKVLGMNYKTKVDLINPPDRPAMEKLVNQFVQGHLKIEVDGKPVQFHYLGYEKDNDAVYSYFQADDIPAAKKIEITNSLMHELYSDQINLMHIIVGGKRKSTKLDYPEKETEIGF
jgi:hypothetical protein